ncbi:hypothetical protein ACFSND_32885 [Brevibacillus brevis]|uniref:hypothetical protein n=1 Tax=Brevibacillus brevis TaxID=1393 RepID=UPI0036415CE2
MAPVFTARRMNHIEEGIKDIDDIVIRMENRILTCTPRSRLETGLPGNMGFLSIRLTGIQDAVIALDKTRTTIQSISGTNVTVASVSGFAVGQEVTLASVSIKKSEYHGNQRVYTGDYAKCSSYIYLYRKRHTGTVNSRDRYGSQTNATRVN